MFRLIGWAVLTLAVLVMVLVFLIYTYLNLPGGLIFQIPGRKLYDFTNQILATSPILSYIWRLTPTGDNQFLFLVLMSFLVWGFVGGKIVRYANNLSGRIRRARHAVEEERWRRSLGGVAGNTGTLSIQLESDQGSQKYRLLIQRQVSYRSCKSGPSRQRAKKFHLLLQAGARRPN
jgi:hypothetical protein